MAELKPTSAFVSCLQPTDADCAVVYVLEKSADSCLFTTKRLLYPCSTNDALHVNVTSDRLLQSFSPVPIYGSVGFISLSTVVSTAETRPFWKQCKNLCYCDGPKYEGETSEASFRYQTRWLFRFDLGLLSYGIVGESLSRATALFPTTVAYDSFSACFDQNAKPVVAFATDSTIELRRTQAGIITVDTFEGESPSLFQNALLQWDDSQQDVVCYYLHTSNLCGRWQRDNFAVEYVLVENVDVDTLFSTRASILSSDLREFLFCQKACSARLLLSARYSPWPIFAGDVASLSIGTVTGTHARLLVDVPGSSDVAAVAVGPVTGIYRPTILQLPGASDSAAVAVATVSGIHKLVLVQAGSYSDTAATDVAPVTGLHKFTLIQAGSYSDAASLTVGPVTGVHAHV